MANQLDGINDTHPTIKFLEGNVLIDGTTAVQSVKNLEGVNDARQEAYQFVLNNDLSGVEKFWPYDVPDAGETITEGNAATFFLGSYTTTVDILDNGNGSYTLYFRIKNKTGWESGTRLIPDEGENEEIIPDKDRGDGIHLGGTIVDIFEWSEIYIP